MAHGEVELRTAARTNGDGDATKPKLNKISSFITQSEDKGASQSMLHACGLTVEDLDKPQVGISSVW